MRFRFCCTCDDEEKPKTVENRSKTVESPQTILPEVITQQPKNVVEPIQLESVQESSIQVTNEEPLPQVTKEEPSKKEPPHREPIPVPRKIEEKQDDISTKDREAPQNPTEITKKEDLLKRLNMIIAEQVAQDRIPSVTQPYSPVNKKSDFSVDTTIDGEKLTFCQIAPDLYRGTFKGLQLK
ncbi:uncharacterized protein LOC129911278 [Episyrphus balteatus]|uniref:uncharacterized protein LOC129911278 n=1 Tax=Episyrphus balteatus TaxID=286459 RepID=UPI002486CA75|nr:uncharacterized protein LOC129911278 [Episyrphus balteatus]